MVGGGIGVTPFSSILKDIVHKVTQNRDTIACKKVGIRVNRSESVPTVWKSVLAAWRTYNDRKVRYCLYLIIPMLN